MVFLDLKVMKKSNLSFEPHKKEVTFLCFVAERRFITASVDKTIKLWTIGKKCTIV